jgi:adenylate cyclase
VLFADLVGFTGRAEQDDPEAVRDFQRRYFTAVAAEVERFGGRVEKYIGDAAMAMFGAPVAHDDDAERALRTALSIRDAIGAFDGGLEVRIGVNTGEVVGGLGAGPQAAEYTVSGDAVNVAARLQQAAAPNEILVGGTTRALSADAFAFAPLTELAVKGRAAPVEAWRLERALPERPRTHGGEARLVGRAREVAAVESALGEVRAGRGLMSALVGEAGIGKSRLALEMRHWAETNGFATVWTASRSYASAFPYHLVGQLAEQLLGRPAPDEIPDALRTRATTADEETLDRWSAALGDVLGHVPADDARLQDLSPAGRQRMLVHALGALLRSASDRQPMLVVLDDLHWADPASLSVVEELLDILPDSRVCLLATYRSGWSHGWEGRGAYEQLNLRALPPEDARRMAAELTAGSGLSEELTDRVLERSAGNPLFLEQLLHGERRVADGGKPSHRLPETIHEMVLARLDALGPEARRTLQLASVVGMEFPERIVIDIAEEGQTRDDDGDGDMTESALRALQRAELVAPRPDATGDRTFAFRHPLIHEVAYRSLLTSTRRQLHGRIGAWLEEHGGEEPLDELARHYRDSDDADKARHYLPLAAERAESLHANREAFGWYTDAAEAFADQPQRRAEMLEAAARQTYLLGRIDEATTQQEEVIRLYEHAGAERQALNARRWLGRFRWLLGDPEQATREIDRAIEGLERLGASPELAMAYSFRSQNVMLEPDFEAGASWARKAIEVAEATGGTEALVHAYNNLGLCLMGEGKSAGVDYLRRSLELALENHLPDDVGRAYANMSGQGTRIFPFPYAESEALLAESIAFSARTIPDGIYDHWLLSGWAEFLIVSGRWSEADRVLGSMSMSSGEAYLASEVASLRSQLAAYRGQFDEVAADVASAADVARRIGDLQAVLPTLAALADVQAGLGDDESAVATIRRAVTKRGSQHEAVISSWFLFEATDTVTSMHARRAESAPVKAGVAALMELAAAVAPDSGAPGDLVQVEVRQALFGAALDQLGTLARAVGVAGPTGVPRDVFPDRRGALATLEREHRLLDVARIRLWLAEEGADGSGFAEAERTFEELGARPYLVRCRALTADSPHGSTITG